MRHYIPKKNNSKSSFVQAILFLIIFIGGLIGYQIIRKKGFTDGMGSFLTSDIESFRALKTMKEEEKEKVKKEFAGFWVNKTEGPDSLPVQKYDYLELKDNGIIWEVISWKVSYPDNDSFHYYYHIKYAYFNPYDTGSDGKTFICEARTIRQIYIYDSDTCFGPSHVDDIWQIRKEKDTILVMNRKRYLPYKGELTRFFPVGMIKLIDNYLGKDCKHDINISNIIKTTLEKSYNMPTCSPEYIKSIIANYFEPAFVEEIFSSIPYLPRLPDSIMVPFYIDRKGNLIIKLSKGKRKTTGFFNSKILNELETWKFPPCEAAEPISINYSIYLPEP